MDLLEELKPKAADAGPRRVVVLLHGLLRSAHCMKAMEAACYQAGFDAVVRFSYASSRQPIGDHAAALRQVLEDFSANTHFSFVGHSMGSIVVRHTIGDLQRDDPAAIVDRCQSLVMLGPPNQGATIARRLAATGLFRIIIGKGGWQLGPKWDEFSGQLATPPFPFAIIAGDMSENRLQNPLIDRSSDYLVGVEEAKLPGCAQFHTLPVIHTMLMTDRRCIELSVNFIQSKAK